MKLSSPREVRSIRLKVGEPCNWSCDFCHNEGDKKANTLHWDHELHNTLITLQNHFQITEVHLTGWEPTLNPDIINMIRWIKEMGLEVKMTTNGQFSEKLRTEIIGSWIDSISVSLHSTHPEDLRKVMSKSKDAAWAEEQIQRSKDNILWLNRMWVRTKINTVISDAHDIPRVQDVFWWAARNNIEMRLLDNLSNKESAGSAIKLFISMMGWNKIDENRVLWTSSTRTSYLVKDVGTFVVKSIDSVFLDWVCQKCSHFGKSTCEEWFYNIRLQKNKWEWMVILCIQNQNEETVLSLEDFISSYGSQEA